MSDRPTHGPPSRGLHRARVLVVGLGALGCAAVRLLGRFPPAGLTLIDPDRVERSNLQRQVIFADGDLGRSKALVAAETLRASTGARGCRVDAVVGRFDASNASELARAHDFVIDGTDDPETKYLINAASAAVRTPFCYGGVLGTQGQFMSVQPGVSACLACAFPPESGSVGAPGGCSAAGILAPVAGVIGSLQAREAFLYLEGSPHFRPGRLVLYQARPHRWRTIEFPRDPNCRWCAAPARAQAPRRPSPCLS